MVLSIIIEYKWLLNSSIWCIGETLTGSAISGQIGPGNNGIWRILHTPQSSGTKASPLNAIQDTYSGVKFFSSAEDWEINWFIISIDT